MVFIVFVVDVGVVVVVVSFVDTGVVAVLVPVLLLVVFVVVVIVLVMVLFDGPNGVVGDDVVVVHVYKLDEDDEYNHAPREIITRTTTVPINIFAINPFFDEVSFC